eukprot:CAMPEP_0172364768 /NCGR_PEP_ID=MMETSP1060-20121228/7817_1 /TAXON_ID=37318 /ORGANISM="Pseudo-nitzschia pungens, Strain cf. cingulata" /LENGTH=561 /DNA_ID=CAMNT_0013087845 /DNA_START=269 /DNA_END=1954 /DNA_ORIENTATION=+
MSTSSTSESTKKNGGSNLILVVGSANQDLTSTSDILPTLGETVMGKNFATACGGKGANQAVAAASLNLAPVAMLCRVGDDLFGRNLLENFRRVGVDYFGEKETVIGDDDGNGNGNGNGEKCPSGVASILVDEKSGDNMIVVSPGANYRLTKEDVQNTVTKSKPSQVLVQLEILPPVALEALRAGKSVGATTILNTAPAPEGWSLEDPEMQFFKHVDVLILNETELRKVSGTTRSESSADEEEKLAKSLLTKGIGKAVIVTLGARGAMIVEKSDADGKTETTHVDAPEDLPARKLPVKNTVGAGDSFCGALAAYRSTGLSLAEAAKYACGVASMSVRKDGAQTSYPLYDELPDCLKLNDRPSKRPKTSPKPLITFVTGNKKKLEEAKQILSTPDSSAPFELTNKKIDLPELQGDPIEIAKEKCRLAAKEVNGAVFTEDTSLCFNALNGLPGPYIKWFLEDCGHAGLNKMLDGFDDRSAYAQTIVAYTTGPGEEIHVFDGRTNGKIVAARGPTDFGWDPVFEPDGGEGKTYAEMTKEFKNSISHRGRSFEKFRAFLAKPESSE